jgi:outer membrane protein TolC
MSRCLHALTLLSVMAAGAGRAGAQAAPEPVTLSLADAVARGAASSHRVDEVTARADAARAVTEQRHAALLPRLSAQGGYMRTNHVDAFGVLMPNNQLRLIHPDIPDNFGTRVDAQWPLYTGGRVQALERAARIEATAAGGDVAATQADLRAEIARAYWALVSASESVRVLDRSLAQVEAHLRDARNRLEAGLVPPNDVLSVEAQQARQEMLRIQAAAGRDVAEAALGRLVDLPPGTRIDPTSALDVPPAAADRFDDLLAAARANRPDRRALSQRVNAAAERTEAAAAARRPTVGVGGGVDYARPNPRIFPREGAWNPSWDASINVDWPLFDGGRAKADVAEAAAAQRAAEARLAEFDSVLALEIRQRLSELASSRAAIEAADTAIRAAAEAHRVVGERFDAGVATSTDVLDAQMTVLQAELDRTQAIALLHVAEAGLARATGR